MPIPQGTKNVPIRVHHFHLCNRRTKEGAGEGPIALPTGDRLGFLMTQLILSIFVNHPTHLIFEVQLLLLDTDFFELLLTGHVRTLMQPTELVVVGTMFLDKATEIRIVGEQVILDLLLFRQQVAPPSLVEG